MKEVSTVQANALRTETEGYLTLSVPFKANIRSSGRPKHCSSVPHGVQRPQPPLGFAHTAWFPTIGVRASHSHWPFVWFATTESQNVPLRSMILHGFLMWIANEPPLSMP